MNHKIPTWHGVVTADGRLRLESIAGFKAWMQTLANKPIELVIRKVTHKRSRNQNAFWHAVVVPMFAEACGYQVHEYDAVHDELMRVLLGTKPGANPELPIRQSSAGLSTDEFNYLIEQAQIFAATKLGLVIPDPDKNWRHRPRKVDAA